MAVWDDAVFLWHPGDAETASSNLVNSSVADATLTEGTIVTSDGHTGRSYVGAVGSRFASPIGDPKTTSWTMFLVARLPSNGLFRGLNFALSSDSDRWIGMWLGSNDASRLFNYRLNGSTVIAADNWPAVTPTDLNGDTSLNTYVLRYTRTDNSNGVLAGFENSSTAFASDTLASANAGDANRLTVGRLEDSSPSDSTVGEAYAAAVWSRALSAEEIDEILVDPFAYLAEEEVVTVNPFMGSGVW